MVADAFYDGKPWVYLSKDELMQGLKRLAGFDMQRTSHEDYYLLIIRSLKMDAIVPVDSRVFNSKCAVRKYITDRGLTEVVRPDGRQYTRKHCKVLVKAIAAGIKPIEFHRKVENKLRFDLVTRDPDALFSIIAKQQRDQATIDANDDVRRQIAKRCNAKLMTVAGTQPQGRTITMHARVPRLPMSKQSGTAGTPTRSALCVASKATNSGNAPKASWVRVGNDVHGQSRG